MTTKISNFFTLEEAVNSNVAQKHGINNTPNEVEEDNIRYAAARMDLFRLFLSRPIIVNSWYRCKQLNEHKEVGGVESSYHRLGLAIDFYCKGNDLSDVFHSLSLSGLSFDQLIYYPKKNFIHISFRRNRESERQHVLVK